MHTNKFDDNTVPIKFSRDENNAKLGIMFLELDDNFDWWDAIEEFYDELFCVLDVVITHGRNDKIVVGGPFISHMYKRTKKRDEK